MEESHVAPKTLSRHSPLHHVAAAAAVGGLTLSFILSPIELVKVGVIVYVDRSTAASLSASQCRLQTRHSPHYGPSECIKFIFRSEGLKGFTRGLGATILREVCITVRVDYVISVHCARRLI